MVQRDKIAADFQQMTGKIEEALSVIPYNELDISDEVCEQVFSLSVCLQ